MTRYWIFAGIFLLTVVGLPEPGLCGWTFPEPANEAGQAAFMEMNSTEGLLLLRDWVLLEVEVDEEASGLSGKRVQVVEYWIGDNSILEEAAQVWTLDSPREGLKDVLITVIRGSRKIHFKKKDLKWSKFTRRSGGVVYLDGTQSVGFIPGLQVGDRVEVVQKHELAGVFDLGWYQLGGSNSPYFQSGLEIRVPESYSLVAGVLGPPQGRERVVHHISREGKWARSTWILEADSDGSLPTCGGDYPTTRITPHLSSTGQKNLTNVGVGDDWTAVGQAYLQRIQSVFDADPKLTAKAAEVVAGAESIHEKIDRLYHHVQTSCHYLGLFEGMGNMIPIPANKVRDLGSGDCKGLATLLIAMLRAVGIESHPVLVRTRDAGPLDLTVPNLTQFNHYIAWADDGQGGVFLDGTTDFYPAGMLPSMDTAWPVLLLRPSAPDLEPVPASAHRAGLGLISVSGNLNLSDTGRPDLDLELEYTVTEVTGASWRGYLAGLSTREREEAVLRYLLPDEPPMTGSEVKIVGLDDWSKPLIIRARAQTSTPLPKVSGRIFLPRTLTGVGVRNPGLPACGDSLDLRPLAVREFQWQIQLPSGFNLAATDGSGLEEAGFSWEENIRQVGQDLLVNQKFQFTRPFVSRDEAQAMSDKIEEAKLGRSSYLELRY